LKQRAVVVATARPLQRVQTTKRTESSRFGALCALAIQFPLPVSELEPGE